MSEQQGDVVGLVEGIVLSLVDEAEQVKIESSQSDDALTIEIRVAPEDVGKVIGRQGRIIKAIRTLSRAVSSYTGGSHIEVEVVDQHS
ncbi:MAG: KH domain-containing protein [Coriobacteriales bacterium]|jgi:predicted RNA-binding protein YlqC (UPF0109 family)|nr:KH domain-containing protein [Coriobacteriales bacterium]